MQAHFLKNSFLVFLASTLFISCFRFRTPDYRIEKQFRKKKAEVRIKRINVESVPYSIRIVSSPVDKDKSVAIFFIHGAPGSSNNYYKYLQDSLLLSKANLYSVDRPGYGYSNFGKAEKSIKKQSEVIAQVIDSLPESEMIVLGHSYGGPIAAYSSLLSPKVKGIIMLAPAIDPNHEKIFWVSYIAKWKLTKWMIPGAMGVAGDEKFSHVEALKEISEDWQNVAVPVLHVHGTKDILVPFENLEFSKRNFNPSIIDTIVIDKGNHFIPWKNYDLVKTEILKMIQALDNK